MNQSKKLLAAFVAIPASVIVASEVHASEVSTTFELYNGFVNETVTSVHTPSIEKISTNKEELEETILFEMNKLTNGLTIEYTGDDVATYKKDITTIFNKLKDNINKSTTIGGETIDNTLLYGLFNNVKVQATETKVSGKITAVKLHFSFNYFGDDSTKKVIEDTKTEVATLLSTISSSSTNLELRKVKAIHDYLIQNSYVAATMNNMDTFKSLGSSAHTYALWTYLLLKENRIVNVHYVSGYLDGQLHSWNEVEIDGKWYTLDTSSDDNAVKASKEIQYKYFLTDAGIREVLIGGTTLSNTPINDFKNIVNPAQNGEVLYFADAENNGKIYKWDLKSGGKEQIADPATSGYGKIIYHKDNNIEYLYFINDNDENYLYRLKISDPQSAELVVKESIKSISLNSTSNVLTYTLQNNTQKTINVSTVEATNTLAANTVINKINALNNVNPNETAILDARLAYNNLLPSQQLLVTNYPTLVNLEATVAQKITNTTVKTIVEEINELNMYSNTIVSDVNDITEAIASLSDADKKLIYNLSIYTSALAQVNAAQAIVNNILKLAKEQNPYKLYPNFIKLMEAEYAKYEKLSPSIRAGLDGTPFTINDTTDPNSAKTISTYGVELKQIREDVNNIVNPILYTATNSPAFLTVVGSNLSAYNNLGASHKSLITDISKVNAKITAYNTMIDQIQEFKELVAELDNVNPTTDLTEEQLKTVNKAKNLYNSMLQSQLTEIANSGFDLTNYNLLLPKFEVDDLNTIITNLTKSSSLVTIQDAIERYNKLSDVDKAKITEPEKLDELLVIISTSHVEDLIKNLSDESLPTEIQAARDAYDALSEEQKKVFSKEALKLLQSYEKELESQLGKAQDEAQLVIDRIKKINVNTYTETQINSIRNAYNALSALAKALVTDDILQILLNAENQIIYQKTVVKQAKQDAAAFDEYMDNIDRYSSTSEIAAARALYNRLSYEAKRHVEMLTKLVRLETMWKDPEYLELVYTYYPDYINAIKPGGIEITTPVYDSLYIPDDSQSTSVANYNLSKATWVTYEDMTYQSGKYVTNITSTQVKNLSDRTLTLNAGDMEVILPVADLKAASGTVGITLSISNNQLNIQFTEGSTTKTFSEYVEVRIPISKLNGTKDKMIERVVSGSTSPASFKVEDSKFVIRTKTSGTFKVATSSVKYTDLGTSSAGQAIAELAKRGITYNTTTTRLVNISQSVTRADVATLIAKALDLSSTSKTKYQDLGKLLTSSRAQGLLEAGIMSGVTSTRFGTNTTVTKKEAAIIIANMYRYLNQDLSLAYNILKTNYTDVESLSYEARQSIAILELFGVVNGYGSFNPNNTITRGEFAELLYKSLKAINFL